MISPVCVDILPSTSTAEDPSMVKQVTYKDMAQQSLPELIKVGSTQSRAADASTSIYPFGNP